MFDELILSINSNIKAQETDSQEICLRASFKSNHTRGTGRAAGQRGGRPSGLRLGLGRAGARRASGARAGAGRGLLPEAGGLDLGVGREMTGASSKPRPTSKLGPHKGRAVHCVWVSVIFQGHIK